jgi:hypothetical protein
MCIINTRLVIFNDIPGQANSTKENLIRSEGEGASEWVMHITDRHLYTHILHWTIRLMNWLFSVQLDPIKILTVCVVFQWIRFDTSEIKVFTWCFLVVEKIMECFVNYQVILIVRWKQMTSIVDFPSIYIFLFFAHQFLQIERKGFFQKHFVTYNKKNWFSIWIMKKIDHLIWLFNWMSLTSKTETEMLDLKW